MVDRVSVMVLNGFVRSPISVLRISFVTAAYAKVRLPPQDPQALISGFLRIRWIIHLRLGMASPNSTVWHPSLELAPFYHARTGIQPLFIAIASFGFLQRVHTKPHEPVVHRLRTVPPCRSGKTLHRNTNDLGWLFTSWFRARPAKPFDSLVDIIRPEIRHPIFKTDFFKQQVCICLVAG